MAFFEPSPWPAFRDRLSIVILSRTLFDDGEDCQFCLDERARAGRVLYARGELVAADLSCLRGGSKTGCD